MANFSKFNENNTLTDPRSSKQTNKQNKTKKNEHEKIKKTTQRHIVIKLLKINDKEKILEAGKEKNTLYTEKQSK